MTETQISLLAIKDKLPRGAQRKIARNLDMHPNTVSLALGGFVISEQTNQKVLHEAETIINQENQRD